MSVEIEPAVCPDETFEQPASEKSRGTSDQDALAAQLLPQRLGARDDVVEIVRQPVCRFCVGHGLTRLRGSCLLGSLRQLCSVNGGGGFWNLMKSLRHVVDHRLCDAGVEADPENVVHHKVG